MCYHFSKSGKMNRINLLLLAILLAGIIHAATTTKQTKAQIAEEIAAKKKQMAKLQSQAYDYALTFSTSEAVQSCNKIADMVITESNNPNPTLRNAFSMNDYYIPCMLDVARATKNKDVCKTMVAKLKQDPAICGPNGCDKSAEEYLSTMEQQCEIGASNEYESSNLITSLYNPCKSMIILLVTLVGAVIMNKKN